MAEIQIERKERRSSWPWIVLILVLVALAAWWLWGRGDGDVVTGMGGGIMGDTFAAAEATVESEAGGVNGFLSFAADARARGGMSLDHRFTAEGIRRLADALNAIARGDTVGGGALEPRLDSLRRHADALERNPQAGTHARDARQAFVDAASIMEDLRQRRFAGLTAEVRSVRQAAESVSPTQPLLEQGSEVRRFFERAESAVRAMSAGANRNM